MDSKILDKIKKCLALSQSSEPHEAASALRQAQKMMDAHGVTQADLGRSDIGSAEFRSKFSVSNIKDYEGRLVNLVASAFGCKVLWRKSHSRASDVYGMFSLIGLKTQVPLAHYTCQVLQRKLVKARAEFVQSLAGRCNRGRKVVEADGFCKGWVLEISKTVHAFALSDETKVLINEEVDRLADGITESQERKAGVYGFTAGTKAASGESIHRPMGASTHKMIR